MGNRKSGETGSARKRAGEADGDAASGISVECRVLARRAACVRGTIKVGARAEPAITDPARRRRTVILEVEIGGASLASGVGRCLGHLAMRPELGVVGGQTQRCR